MSIGSVSYSQNYIGYGGFDTTKVFNKNWNGGDGKYDAQGNLQWNAYSMSRREYTRQEYLGKVLECYSDTPIVFSEDPNLELRALDGLASQIKGFDFNALVAYGERAQTIKLVTDTILSISKAVKQTKKGNLLGALKALGYSGESPKKHKFTGVDVASRFLEIQYGWLPALNDVYGAMDAYERLTRGPRFKVFKSSASSNEIVTVPYTKGDSLQKKTTRVVYYAKLSEPPSTLRQLGLLNPASLLWERTPFSFIGDWFVPIGSYLDLTGFFFGLEGNFLKSVTHTGTMIETGHTFWEGMQTDARVVNSTRTPLSSLSVPTPAFKPLDKALSSMHVTNAIALLTSIVGGRKLNSQGF